MTTIGITQPEARRITPKPKVAATGTPGSQSVAEVFNTLLNGIRHADVKAVSNVYWNSPRLILFNNNGTVTKGWDQMRKNRESSYPDVTDVTTQSVWAAGELLRFGGNFNKFVQSRDLVKQEVDVLMERLADKVVLDLDILREATKDRPSDPTTSGE